MPAPTIEKTWQYSVNQLIAAGASITASHQNLIYALKQALISFPLSPCTVAGSSNATAGGMDGVDRFTAPALWTGSNSDAGARSWVVLAFPGQGGAQLLIEARGTTSSYERYWRVFWSASGAFTGGSQTARPTAVDEVALHTGGVTPELILVSNSTPIPTALHVMLSSDGTQARFWVYLQGEMRMFGLLGMAGDPVGGGWSGKLAGLKTSTSAGIGTLALWADASALKTHHATELALQMTCPAYTSGGTRLFVPLATAGLYTNTFDSTLPLLGIGLVSDTAGRSGVMGRMVDLWWGSTVVPDARPYGTGAARDFMQTGHFVHPWDGSLMAVQG